jgi:hypothetical protein
MLIRPTDNPRLLHFPAWMAFDEVIHRTLLLCEPRSIYEGATASVNETQPVSLAGSCALRLIQLS